MINLLDQPVSDIQLSQLQIEWVPYESIRPNKYNPNKMTWHDRMLLRQSLLEDGWTQPIVTLPDHTIVDGEQRWTTAGIDLKPRDIQDVIDKMLKRQEQGASVSESILVRLHESKRRLEEGIAAGLPARLATVTGGLVPITRLDLGDDAHKMISTIRHNRARGSHQIDAMTAITNDLVQLGLDVDDLETRLGMDDEEINRFLRAAEGLTGQLEADLSATPFSQAWQPVHIAELDERAQVEFERSIQANEGIKRHQLELAARKAEIERAKQAEVAKIEAERGAAVTQIEKEAITKRLEQAAPKPPPPQSVELKKIVVFVTADEYRMITGVLGENMAVGLVTLCQAEADRRAGA